MMDDSGVIILAVAVTVGSAEFASVKGKHGFVMKPVIAGFILGGILFLIAAVNPELGRAFAWLAMIASLLLNGTALVNGAVSLTSSTPTKGK